MKEFGIPNKIVIAGTSAMKLNDRFSNLPPPRKNMNRGNKPINAIVTTEVYNPFVSAKVQPLRFQESVPRRRFRASHRPQTFSSRLQNVPIESRLSIPFVPTRGKPVARGRGAGRGVARGKVVKTMSPIITNETRPLFRNRGISNKPGKRGGKPIRGNTTKPQGKNEIFGSKKSVEQLDRELDDYMRKKKHAPIII